MVEDRARGLVGWPPIGAPQHYSVVRSDPPHSFTAAAAAARRESNSQWEYDDSVNAVSFGLVATAILISMFLLMAIFEKLLRPSLSSSPSPSSAFEAGGGPRRRVVLESNTLDSKLHHPSPKMTVYDDGLSVLMPGDRVPSFIAHPAPMPCPREHILRPPHQRDALS